MDKQQNSTVVIFTSNRCHIIFYSLKNPLPYAARLCRGPSSSVPYTTLAPSQGRILARDKLSYRERHSFGGGVIRPGAARSA